MSIPQTIRFVADTAALERTINSLNRQIGDLSEAARLNFRSREAEDGLNRVNNRARDTKFSVDALGKSFAKMAGIIGGSVVASIAAMNSGLNELSKGFTTILGYRANQYFSKQATILQSATNGFINYGEALKVAKDIPNFISDKQIKQIAKLSATLELANGSTEKTAATMKEFMLAMRTGRVKETIQLVDPEVYESLRKVAENKNFNITRKRQEMLIVMQKRLLASTKETNGALETGMSKLLGVINSVSEKFKALGGVIKGVGLIAAGVLGPLGAGIAGFTIGGPIVGLITTAIGGVISAIFGKQVIDLIAAIREGKNPVEALTNKISLLIAKLNAFIEGLLGKKLDMKVMASMITSELKSRGLKATEANRDMILKEIMGYQMLGNRVGGGVVKAKNLSENMWTTFADSFTDAFRSGAGPNSPIGKLDKSINESFSGVSREFVERYKGRHGMAGQLASILEGFSGPEAGGSALGAASAFGGSTLGAIAAAGYGVLVVIKSILLSVFLGIVSVVSILTEVKDAIYSIPLIKYYLSGVEGKGSKVESEEPTSGGSEEKTSIKEDERNFTRILTEAKGFKTEEEIRYYKNIEKIADILEKFQAQGLAR